MIAYTVNDVVVEVLEDNAQVMYRGASISAAQAATAPDKTGYYRIVSTHNEDEKPYRYTINKDTGEVTYSKTWATWAYTEYSLRVKASDKVFMLPLDISYFFIQWLQVVKLRELPIVQNHLPHVNHLYINEFDPASMRQSLENLQYVGYSVIDGAYVVGAISENPSFIPIFGELETGSLVTINDIEEWM